VIPESFLEELKYRSDIEQIVAPYTGLKRTGRNLTGLCPFHSEKTPSFVVYPENGSFYCFGCGAGGDIISFVRLAEHLEYVEAVRFLAQKAGMALPEEAADDPAGRLKLRILELNREAARFFHAALTSPAGARGMEYLTRRGITHRTIRRFGLGYAPDGWEALCRHLKSRGFSDSEMLSAAVARQGRGGRIFDMFRDRVMFPIIDLRGSVVGFGGRLIADGHPKYLNSADTPVFKKSRGLFAMNFAKASRRPLLILCEGYMDAIAVHQAGFDNAVAALGTALTDEQARLIAQYAPEAVIAYDADEAGRRATERATRLLSKAGVRVRVLSMKGAKDPDEFIKSHGSERFGLLVEGSRGATEYEIAGLKEKYDTDSDEGKVVFLREFCALMARLPDRIEADVYAARIAQELSVSKEALAEQIATLRAREAKRREKKFERSLKIYAQDIPNQPYDAQRAENLRYALAEDKLIALLLRNPDYFGRIADSITPAQFVTDSNRALFEVIWRRLAGGKSVDMVSLSADLSMAQMARLSYLLASVREWAFTADDAQSYAAAILQKAAERTDEQVAAMSGQELKEYVSGIAAKKK
jgi:DNA primase